MVNEQALHVRRVLLDDGLGADGVTKEAFLVRRNGRDLLVEGVLKGRVLLEDLRDLAALVRFWLNKHSAKQINKGGAIIYRVDGRG